MEGKVFSVTMKTVSRCLHDVQEAVWTLALVYCRLVQFLVEPLVSGAGDGAVCLLEHISSRLSVAEYVFRYIALVTSCEWAIYTLLAQPEHSLGRGLSKG